MTASGPQARTYTRVSARQNDFVIDRNRNKLGEHSGAQLYCEFLTLAIFFVKLRAMERDSLPQNKLTRFCEFVFTSA